MTDGSTQEIGSLSSEELAVRSYRKEDPVDDATLEIYIQELIRRGEYHRVEKCPSCRTKGDSVSWRCGACGDLLLGAGQHPSTLKAQPPQKCAVCGAGEITVGTSSIDGGQIYTCAACGGVMESRRPLGRMIAVLVFGIVLFTMGAVALLVPTPSTWSGALFGGSGLGIGIWAAWQIHHAMN